MRDYQRAIQMITKEHGSFLEIVRKFGAMKIIDFILSSFLNQISKRFCTDQRIVSYGLREAIFHSRDIDRWARYKYVTNEVRKIKGRNLSILDVGSGGLGISIFLSPLRSDYDLFLLDARKDAFKVCLRRVHPIVGDGCKLPFRDKVFDIVVAVDTVEHIPKSIRHDFLKQLKRVCKKRIIITCPIQSNDGIFQGKKYDITFQYLYEKNYGVKERNTAQHIAAGHPILEEIRKELPNSTIYGYKNCDVWLKYMLFSRKPFLGLFTGLLYYLFWERNVNKPPYWGAIIVANLEIFNEFFHN